MRYISLSWILDYLTVSSIPTASSTSARYHHKNILFIVTICYAIKSWSILTVCSRSCYICAFKSSDIFLILRTFSGHAVHSYIKQNSFTNLWYIILKTQLKTTQKWFCINITGAQIIEIFSKKFIRKYNYGWEK